MTDDVNYCSVCFRDTVFRTEDGRALCTRCGHYLFPDEDDDDDFDLTEDVDSSSPYW